MKVLVAVLLGVVVLSAQSAPVATFEVVSVKRNRSGDANSQTRPRPDGGLQVTNNTLRQMIRNAYQREEFLMVGGPAWLDVDRFDVIATGAGEDRGFEALLLRMRALLADRFGLRVHDDRREMALYELARVRPDRLGPQLRVSAIDCSPAAAGTPRPAPIVPPGAPVGEAPLCGIRRRSGLLLAGGAPIDEVSRALAGLIGRPVVDRTGLTGPVDLALAWDPDLTGGQGVSVFAAVKEQLGLELTAGRGPVDVLVIDHAERPTDN